MWLRFEGGGLRGILFSTVEAREDEARIGKWWALDESGVEDAEELRPSDLSP